jgi:transposase
MAVDGSTDNDVFHAYVLQVLLPSLRPGDLVIMDNLSPHKNSQAIELIEKAGAKALFLPAYSPDLNPIEKMWSKIKEYLRAAEARTHDALIEAIGKALANITPQDAMNWFACLRSNFLWFVFMQWRACHP